MTIVKAVPIAKQHGCLCSFEVGPEGHFTMMHIESGCEKVFALDELHTMKEEPFIAIVHSLSMKS